MELGIFEHDIFQHVVDIGTVANKRVGNPNVTHIWSRLSMKAGKDTNNFEQGRFISLECMWEWW